MKNTLVKILFGVLILPIVFYLGYLGYLAYLAPEPAATAATPEPEVVETGPLVISAEGKVLPSRYVELSFKAPGLVEEVLVAKGDRVEKGQVIARLNGHDQVAASVTAAQLELISAKQSLDELYEHTDLRRAEAQQAVLEAQDQVDEAQRIVNSLTTPSTQAQIDAAENAVAVAEKNRNTAENKLDGLSSKPPGNPERAAAELALLAAERQYQAAVAYENAVKSGPNEEKIAEAEMNLEIAQIHLEEAERKLEILQNGPDPDEVALAQARVDHAEAQLAAAEAALDDLNLTTPFEGEIITLNLKVGETTNPNSPSVVLADLSSWRVETTDLSETDVSRISPGMDARIVVNAFPDRTFTGSVEEVDLQGVEQRGTVTYAVSLDFDPLDAPMRMGMSAFVEVDLPEAD